MGRWNTVTESAPRRKILRPVFLAGNIGLAIIRIERLSRGARSGSETQPRRLRYKMRESPRGVFRVSTHRAATLKSYVVITVIRVKEPGLPSIT